MPSATVHLRSTHPASVLSFISGSKLLLHFRPGTCRRERNLNRLVSFNERRGSNQRCTHLCGNDGGRCQLAGRCDGISIDLDILVRHCSDRKILLNISTYSGTVQLPYARDKMCHLIHIMDQESALLV